MVCQNLLRLFNFCLLNLFIYFALGYLIRYKMPTSNETKAIFTMDNSKLIALLSTKAKL